MSLIDDHQPAIAQAIATAAHHGQTDKAGQPYIGHPTRVAARIVPQREFFPTLAAAWLHDVLEDTPLTRETLALAGVTPHVIGIVELLTRKRGQSDEDYYALIRGNSRALEVKLADIADNTSPERLALLDDATLARLTRKYAKARAALGVTGA